MNLLQAWLTFRRFFRAEPLLREDFLENSGLDRFYVEELEREFYELNDLNMEELYQIRKGFN